jgi:NAD(P)H-dependent FMN reductase
MMIPSLSTSISDFNLPLLNEPIPPSQGQYSKDHTKRWSAKIDSFDAFIFVTAEYNHGIPGALKNAIDFLYRNGTTKLQGLLAVAVWWHTSIVSYMFSDFLLVMFRPHIPIIQS